MMNMDFEKKLTIPMEVKQMYPITKNAKEIVSARDKELKNILSGKSGKFILIIGPCSADNEESVLDYVCRLAKINEEVKDKLFIIPRIYTNKPRTNGEGYKGMLHQPNPNEKPNLYQGIVATRELHIRALTNSGLSAADEMLYPENLKYLDDLLGYVTVGARSVENQQHRLTASGLDTPVGMKNPTGGDFEVMLNAVNTAQNKHTFAYRGWEVHSHGNPFAHVILRGYMNKHEQAIPNYHYEDLLFLASLYEADKYQNPAVIVDTNHANSSKIYSEQIRIAKEVLQSRALNPAIKKLVKGLMIESYIEDGAQTVGNGVYGKSITDACLGWDKTQRLIYDIASAI